MKRILITLLMAMPLLASAQDNTWERVEQEPVEKENPDAKYLKADAVPAVDGIVCWQTVIQAPGKTARQIYDILLNQLTRMTQEPNQINNSVVAVQDPDNGQLGAVFHEWLVFKSTALSLDRTQLNFQILVQCTDGQADIKLTRVSYDYEAERNGSHMTAEEWIIDKYAVNKKHTRLLPMSGKFRRKTIDRKDFIFNKFTTLLNEK